MALLIKQGEFEIAEATLTGIVPDPKHNRDKGLYWYLSIDTVEREIGDQTYSPILYHQSLPLKTRRWIDFEKRTFSWDTAKNGEQDAQDCGIAMPEHEDIFAAKLRFLHRNGALFDLKWNGFSDWNRFALTACVEFVGVEVRGNERDADTDMYERLANFLDPDDYIQNGVEVDDFRYASGLRLAQALFAPRLDQ